MASTRVVPTSDDVPGATIDFNKLNEYGNVQLKRWLECRGLKLCGNRPELLKRCRDVYLAGQQENIGVDGG
ncbi:hypothetical protein SNE40_006109 [Patella caerulea]|uniref:SAP domain-containing protein n=1 Tax=Patella caerulea TaxID=87958 RepID=A0AAN8JZP7_PATCE